MSNYNKASITGFLSIEKLDEAGHIKTAIGSGLGLDWNLKNESKETFIKGKVGKERRI